ncbi:DUF6986 family protein [Quadrisphaera sp. KR29]|uniref:DUF6986 family protein n=1 Tax=Quadrisphaera sp. KR29 TaxID=3461391 RepID=UPI00404493A5
MDDLLARLDERLADLDAALAAPPVQQPVPQPVHTVYVAADAGDDATAQEWGRRALGLLARHAPTAAALAAATGLDVDDDDRERLLQLLRTRPVADLRLDLEDGYGPRGDAEEDAHADAAGAALARVAGRRLRGQVAPVSAGARVRSFEAGTRRRAVRTLARVVASLVATAERGAGAPEVELGALPGHLVVTLAKVSDPVQVAALADVLDALEDAHGLDRGWVRVEAQVEVPALVVAPDGRAAVARCREAARGRLTGLHYGTYDFSAACGVPPAAQALDHPLADHAKAVLQLATAGTGVAVSDGSTNALPTGGPDGSDTAQVHAAWALHARLVTRALDRGLVQGWDLHPGHLVTRHLANLVHARAELPEAERRLAAWVAATVPADGGGAADGDGAADGVADEPATAQAMARLLVRADVVGAQGLADSSRRVGLDEAALRALAGRRVA